MVSVENDIVSIDLDERQSSFGGIGKFRCYGNRHDNRGDTNGLGVGTTIAVDYELEKFSWPEVLVEDVLAANPVCAGGTLDLAGGVITQYRIFTRFVYDAASDDCHRGTPAMTQLGL